ncbi:MAG: ATP-binding cassette domain-containing protein [Micrococcaceae bacterium]
MLEVKDLRISTRVSTILELENFCIPPASIVTVSGKNGTGKTTLLNFTAGIKNKLKVTYSSYDKNFTMLAYAPDNSYNYFGSMLSSDVINFANKNSAKDINIARVGLGFTDQLLERKVSDLSYGEQKKIYLMIAFSVEADLYIFDEPFSGLDDTSIAFTRQSILNLKANRSSVLVVDHNKGVLFSISDKHYELS